jgi:hypothetical protein
MRDVAWILAHRNVIIAKARQVNFNPAVAMWLFLHRDQVEDSTRGEM